MINLVGLTRKKQGFENFQPLKWYIGSLQGRNQDSVQQQNLTTNLCKMVSLQYHAYPLFVLHKKKKKTRIKDISVFQTQYKAYCLNRYIRKKMNINI